MPLQIEKVGLEQYAPGGNARVQMLLIGGPGAGKTRTASFWPKPIYADCERGMASVADRGVHRAPITSSRDMLDLLAHLKLECTKPPNKRNYETLVIDTLDAYQRIVQDEWVQRERAPSFTGGEAWGYLDGKMQILMRRALNLDMNVVMLVHFEEKSLWGEDEVKTVIQMQGKMKNQAFNDFDLVGWLGTYWEANDEGERVKKRGITFEATPSKDFLKDRFHVMPDWVPINFTEADYTQLLDAVLSKIDDFEDTEVTEDVPEYDPRLDTSSTPQGMPVLEDVGGPLPPDGEAIPNLDEYKKSELQEMAEKVGVSIEDDEGKKLLKAELKDALEQHLRDQKAAEAENDAVPPQDSTPEQDAEAAEATTPEEALAAQGATESDVDDESEDAPEEPEDDDTDDAPEADEAEEADEEGTEPADEDQEEPESDDSDETPVEEEAEEADSSESESDDVCAQCGKSLEGENMDYVRLSEIKYRERLCNKDFHERRRKDQG